MKSTLTGSKILADLKLLARMEADQDVPELVLLRGKLISLAFILGIIVCPIFAVIYYTLGDIVLTLGCVAATAVCVALIFVANTKKGSFLVREALTLTAFSLSVLITYRSGGTASPMMLWMIVCPVIAITSGGKVAGVIWSTLTLLAILGIYLSEEMGLQFQPVLQNIDMVFFLSSFTLIVFLVSIMAIFETLSVQLISKLNSAVNKVHELAIRDELTGTYGRRELLRLLDLEVQRSQRNGAPLTLALMDVDAFKQINDTHGHAVGDLVLKELSDTIENNKRQTDHFGRYGGEEFLLVMADADLEAGRLISQRLHQKVKELSFASDQVPAITLSIGLCQFKNGMKIDELISLADQAMYQAKSSGRDRIVSFGASETSDSAAAFPSYDESVGNNKFEDTANNSPTIVWISDQTGATIFMNRKWTEVTGQSVEEAKSFGWLDMVHPDDREHLGVTFTEAKEAGQVFLARYRLKTASGDYRWVLDTGSPRIDDQGRFQGYIGGVVDIHDGKIAEEALYVSNQRFKAAIDAVEGSMWTTDAAGNFVDVQPQWEKLTGHTFDEYKGVGWTKPIHPDDLDNFLAAAYRSIETGLPLDVEQRLRNKEGEYRRYAVKASPVRNADGTIREWVGVHTDITERRANEEQVVHLATHDSLTNLPNRLLLDDRLLSLTLQREDTMHAVLFMDMNRFKVINDTLGHSVGDQLLAQVARLLTSSLRAGDTVARIGGDEFVMVLQNVKSEADVTIVAMKILELLAQPIFIAEHELILNASIGVAMYPQDGRDVSTLLKHADLAMYQAKGMGGNSIEFYDHKSNVRIEERLVMERDLRHAFQNQELYLDYQPKVDINEQRVQGLEALLRWRHPTRGFIPPSDFIPLAEEIGLIGQIGEWVLRKAASQLQEWHEEGLGDLKIAVNLSVHQLNSPSFLPKLRALVDEKKIDPGLIELEITESALMLKIQSYESILEEIKSIGFTLAIDDFGTGYSSLSYLKRLPIETLKIDRSFIMDIHEDSDDAAIVSATISMAHKMGLAIVAEGVETKEQVAFLQENGCVCMQGYYFSRPVSPTKAKEFIMNFQSVASSYLMA